MKVLLADDHALFRESMQHLLCQLGSDVNIIEAASFDEACPTSPRFSVARGFRVRG